MQTVNARDLHAFLEIGKDFSSWIKAYDFVERGTSWFSPILAKTLSAAGPRVRDVVSVT